MYWVSPLTYFVDSMAAAGLHDRPVECSATEVNRFNPPRGTTCGAYMKPYLSEAPGQLLNPDATSDCQYCALSRSDEFLAGSGIYWDQRWRNSSIMWSYI